MEDVDFSDEFCRFVQVHVPSVDEAELLLAEYRSPRARAPRNGRAGRTRVPHLRLHRGVEMIVEFLAGAVTSAFGCLSPSRC
jgi:hypothetical protein